MPAAITEHDNAKPSSLWLAGVLMSAYVAPEADASLSSEPSRWID